jgi:fused signal recognition particle receptor
MMQSDPFEYLLNAGSHENTWLLLIGPLVILLLLVLSLSVIIRLKRRQEQRQFEADLRSLPEERSSSLERVISSEISSKLESLPSYAEQQDILSAFRKGLARTRDALAGGLTGIFSAGARIDEQTLEKMHEVLYRADVGVKASDRLVAKVKEKLVGQTVDWSTMRVALADAATSIFSEAERLNNIPGEGLYVLLIVGVNGVGKTTTIGKLALKFKSEGKRVMLCAADTFRAAAIEQLVIWGERNDVPVIKQHQGADPAAVAFDGVQSAKAKDIDVLIIDTAGRLHNKNNLMEELSKIRKSISKAYNSAPHDTWIVVDATTGQNAIQQVKAFNEVTSLSGIVVTKLDGTAKGGVIIGIADEFKIPIRYVGVGESAVDLRVFDSEGFMQSLLDSSPSKPLTGH